MFTKTIIVIGRIKYIPNGFDPNPDDPKVPRRDLASTDRDWDVPLFISAMKYVILTINVIIQTSVIDLLK